MSVNVPFTVLYDKRCVLCRRVRKWLELQPKYVEMTFVEAASKEAYNKFPEVDHNRTLTELTVISDNGDVYKGEKAWVICLWALQEYREWSVTLSTPELFPLAQRMIMWVSSNRFKISKFLGK